MVGCFWQIWMTKRIWNRYKWSNDKQKFAMCVLSIRSPLIDWTSIEPSMRRWALAFVYWITHWMSVYVCMHWFTIENWYAQNICLYVGTFVWAFISIRVYPYFYSIIYMYNNDNIARWLLEYIIIFINSEIVRFVCVCVWRLRIANMILQWMVRRSVHFFSLLPMANRRSIHPNDIGSNWN